MPASKRGPPLKSKGTTEVWWGWKGAKFSIASFKYLGVRTMRAAKSDEMTQRCLAARNSFGRNVAGTHPGACRPPSEAHSQIRYRRTLLPKQDSLLIFRP